MWSGLRRGERRRRPRRRDWRGASPPANPYSFVRKHHVHRSKASASWAGVVPHPPQTLIPSSGSTTPLSQNAPPAGSAWCPISRKPLFLRPEAPRPQPKQLRRRGRRGVPPPAKPYSFVRKHHALSPNGSAGAVGGRSPHSFLLPPRQGRSPPRVFRRRSRHNSWK